MKKRGRGRPSKLSAKITRAICKYIRLGHTYEVASQLAGINQSTYHRWRARGQKAKSGVFRDFCESIESAIAVSEAVHLKQIVDAATASKFVKETRTTHNPDGSVKSVTVTKEVPPDWQASKFILERRFPHRWGSRKAIELSTEDGKPLPVVVISNEMDLNEL